MKEGRIVVAMFILLILIAGMIFGISLLWSFHPPSEPEINQIKVNERTALNRNLAYRYNFPRTTEGFSATITLK